MNVLKKNNHKAFAGKISKAMCNSWNLSLFYKGGGLIFQNLIKKEDVRS